MKRSLLILTVVLAAFIGAILGILFAVRYLDVTPSYVSIADHQKTVPVKYRVDSSVARVPEGLNFQDAARVITPAVVHIRTVYGPGVFSLNPLQPFSPNQNVTQSSGSGVILTDDGYIVTNHHVIEDATTIEVVMNNNQHFYANLIGADPLTDLALLKIKAKKLPFIRYGDSDVVTPGEWVLAVGNPFDLTSTVTAGIVSAKARNIAILADKNHLDIESFIQTDAAVNPGNSGGALVNLRGELIGINSAIATTTGMYSGYSFAIPVTLVKKVMDDLKEFGEVQRGFLGVEIQDVTAQMAENRHLDVVSGVYVSSVHEGSAAQAAGIQVGDVIVGIDDHAVTNMSELQERVARNRPGQSVKVTYRRSGSSHQTKAQLKNLEGNTKLKQREITDELGGASFEELTYQELNWLNIDGGVRIKKLEDGKWKKAGLHELAIITYIDKVPVDNIADLNRILELKHGGILVEGLSKAGEKVVYGVDW